MGSNKGIVEKHLMKIIYDAWTIIIPPLLWLSRKRFYAFVKLQVFKIFSRALSKHFQMDVTSCTQHMSTLNGKIPKL